MTDITLSPETVAVLKNFSTINQSIKVEPGSILRTMSNFNVIMGKATVKETFEHNWVIYDLPRFISTFEVYDKPSFDFGEHIVTISEQGSNAINNTSYRYGEASIVHSTTKDIDIEEFELEFTLKEEDLSKLLKFASVLQVPHMIVEPSQKDAKKITVSVLDLDNAFTNINSIDIDAEGVDGRAFKFVYKVCNILVIPQDYNIKVSNKLISNWINNDGNIEYWVALETSSQKP